MFTHDSALHVICSHFVVRFHSRKLIIMSDKADSLCNQMNDANLATSSEDDMPVSDSILDSEDDNINRLKDYNYLESQSRPLHISHSPSRA